MKLPFKVNERERKFIIIGGIVGLLVVIVNGFSWYSDLRKNIEEISAAKRSVLERQIEKLSEKDEIDVRFRAVTQEIEMLEKTFLRGDKPPVAAAVLQRFLKENATSLGIDVKLERTLSPVDADVYLGIPVEIGFTASTEKLKDLLYNLRTAPFLLTVSELKISVTNISNPVDVYTTVVVTGFIKKPEMDKDEKETKDVT